MADPLDASVKKLIAKGKERGYLTYEEMNDDLPEEAVSPDRLDSLLMTLDELGIELIDESEADQREPEQRFEFGVFAQRAKFPASRTGREQREKGE